MFKHGNERENNNNKPQNKRNATKATLRNEYNNGEFWPIASTFVQVILTLRERCRIDVFPRTSP